MHSQPKPNFTAWFVMQGTIAAMHQPHCQAIADESTLKLYRPLANAASKTRIISWIIHHLPYRWQYRIGEMVTSRGRLRHFCFRKKEIEKSTRQLLSNGSIKQIVILGAGLDVLSLRLAAEYPDVQFIEIDTGESQHFKTSSFKTHAVALPTNVEFLMGDLRDPLSGILARSRFQAATRTLWIAEGFFMFIPEASVVRILKEIAKLSATNSHVIFTSLTSYKTTTPLKYSFQTFYLHKEKSPYQWAIALNDVQPFVENLGYEHVAQTDYDTLHQKYMCETLTPNRDIAENIHIVKI